MAKGFTYFNLKGLTISPDNQWVAFSVDTVGRRIYTMQIKNLVSGELASEKIENITGSATWANDNQTLFYTRKDAVTLRADSVYKHQLGTDASADSLVYFEKDDTFDVSVYKEKSKKYVVIASSSTLTSEYQVLNADAPNGTFKVFQKEHAA